MVWGPLIAGYLFLAGASAGAFATSAYLDYKHPSTGKISFAGRIIALVALCIGLIMLMVDASAGLANPGRFFLLFSNPASVMTIGVYIICLFMIVLIAQIVMDVMKRKKPAALGIIGSVLALCLAAYTGFLLGAAAPYPLWSNAALPILFVVSGASAGLAAVLIAGLVINSKAVAGMKELTRAGVALPIVEIFVLFCMLFIVNAGSPEGATSVAMMLQGEYAPMFWLGIVIVGLLMPLALEAYSMKADSHGPVLGYIANGGVLIGGFCLRYVVIMAAVMIFTF